MHTLVRRYIKTGIAFLGIGLALGAYMIIGRELLNRYPSTYLTSAHTHAIFVGFVMMMILGVALWLFPRPEKDDRRYSPRAAETAYWTLTIATATRVAGEVLRSGDESRWLRWAVVLGGIGQVAGLAIFFYTMWSRIRPAGSQGREARGERF